MIKFYYDTASRSQESIAKTALAHLILEGNTQEEIMKSVGDVNLQYADISEFDVCRMKCEEAVQMISNDEVEYVIEINDSDGAFFYVVTE